MKAKSRVYDANEFVNWFSRQVSEEMRCREVEVDFVEIFRGEVHVLFTCDGKSYVAVMVEGRKFRVSTYQFVLEGGKVVGVEPFKLRGSESLLLAKATKFSGSALFYVEDDVVINVYEIPTVRQ